MKVLFALKATVLVMLLQADSAYAASKEYKAQICENCSASQAFEIAKGFEPIIQCRSGAFHPDEQECYSTTNEIVIFNARTRTSYGFYNGHENQGSPAHELSNFIVDINNLPSEVDIMLNNIVNNYNTLNNIASTLFHDSFIKNISNSQGLLGLDRVYSSDECKSHPSVQTLKYMTDSSKIAHAQIQAQLAYDNNVDFRNSVTRQEITSAGFSIGLGQFGATGSWVNIISPKLTIWKFTNDSSVLPNQIGYKLDLIDGRIKVGISGSGTLLDGAPLDVLKDFGGDASTISKCLADELDNIFPKTIIAPNGSLVGGGPNGAPSFGNSSLISSGTTTGGIPGGSAQQCMHHYYDRFHPGVIMFSFLGSCP
ncbi:hypothetical protein [Pseudoalteromonas tunicata]|jgi:hypothetical protein|uniref:Orphan protein n=1 Tax=Pseudoalteromonas tunicata D2 TaxID=87626 RepID=A4C720_9GAMM|nr:hypothetical protein [Pseudoalteromonas tunicata]ATC95744.1 hypothetical protein PTUN_a3407 [Pseudoalteromonas tunicata]AXT31298.1 hypothetical protein D1819_11070 [Pseudoalteromonas tunicata]EAR29774.1 hypothetical protein PTD2_13179 [Pseudoalteromonas tunicata D2]